MGSRFIQPYRAVLSPVYSGELHIFVNSYGIHTTFSCFARYERSKLEMGQIRNKPLE